MAPYRDRGIMYVTDVGTSAWWTLPSRVEGDAEDNTGPLSAWLDADVIKAGLGLGVTSLSA